MKLKMKCPLCGKNDLSISVCDDEGNIHGDVGCEYENNPWSGLGYAITHDNWGSCLLCTDGEICGGIIFDTVADAKEAIKRRG